MPTIGAWQIGHRAPNRNGRVTRWALCSCGQDYVIDLGYGDGRTVITAAKRGAKALGIEYNAHMVELAQRKAAEERVTGRATFVRGDIFPAVSLRPPSSPCSCSLN